MDSEPNHQIWLAGLRPTSLVDGLGINYLLFLQGCSHEPKCKGCHNPSTHEAHVGMPLSIDQVFQMVTLKKLPAGVTFSGGEPLDQYDAVAALAKRFKVKGYRTTLYTGYAIDKPECCYDLSMFDYVIDGRYVEEEKDVTFNLKGSKNQRFLKASKNFPGVFQDVHTKEEVRQFIYKDLDIGEVEY